jgi:ubiquinone biosynthesis protein COQ4
MDPSLAATRTPGIANALHQTRLFAKGIAHFVRHPTSRQTFTALSEALVRFRANADAIDFMLRDPRIAELCRERYTGRPYTPAELIKYPPGSLGHEFAASMMANDFDPEFYRDYYGKEPYVFKTDEEYLRFRIRQTHDIVHVLTGFGVNDFPGELGMQAFHAAQTRRPFSIALVGFGFIRILFQPKELPETLHQVAKGLAMGFAATSLVAERFEEDWSKTVDEWRKELGLVHEASFDFGTYRESAKVARSFDKSTSQTLSSRT